MSQLRFEGKVKTGDGYRVYEDEEPGVIHIGGVDIVDEIAEQKWTDNVRVILNGKQIANGRAVTATGWGYSEYTPMETDEAAVGDCDLLERLESLEGETVVLVIEDV